MKKILFIALLFVAVAFTGCVKEQFDETPVETTVNGTVDQWNGGTGETDVK